MTFHFDYKNLSIYDIHTDIINVRLRWMHVEGGRGQLHVDVNKNYACKLRAQRIKN